MPKYIDALGGELILGPGRLQCDYVHRMTTTRNHMYINVLLKEAGVPVPPSLLSANIKEDKTLDALDLPESLLPNSNINQLPPIIPDRKSSRNVLGSGHLLLNNRKNIPLEVISDEIEEEDENEVEEENKMEEKSDNDNKRIGVEGSKIVEMIDDSSVEYHSPHVITPATLTPKLNNTDEELTDAESDIDEEEAVRRAAAARVESVLSKNSSGSFESFNSDRTLEKSIHNLRFVGDNLMELRKRQLLKDNEEVDHKSISESIVFEDSELDLTLNYKKEIFGIDHVRAKENLNDKKANIAKGSASLPNISNTSRFPDVDKIKSKLGGSIENIAQRTTVNHSRVGNRVHSWKPQTGIWRG